MPGRRAVPTSGCDSPGGLRARYVKIEPARPSDFFPGFFFSQARGNLGLTPPVHGQITVRESEKLEIRMQGEFLRRKLLFIGGLAVTGAWGATEAWNIRLASDQAFAREVWRTADQAEQIRRNTVRFVERTVPAGVAFHQALVRFDVDPRVAMQVVDAARDVFDLRRVRAGNRVAIGHSLDGELRAIRYQIDVDRMLLVTPATADDFTATVAAVPAVTKLMTVIGSVEGSLFESVMDAGEEPELAILLADIFGWDLDFHSDPRRGDTFRVAVEKKVYPGGETRYERILAAEYVNAGKPYQAVLFRDPAGKQAYYAPDGSSLQKAFLRSPLKFSAPITSRFSRNRFHPVLKRHRPHLGIDYGAPTGAPVQAIGEGRVVFAGYRGGNGNYVHIRHANGYETMYLHLSRILVRTGAKVNQGQVIGRVGSTGLASGPHLDFRITQNGVFRNFAALNLPPADPVARSLREQFALVRDEAMALLNRQPDAATPASAQPQRSELPGGKSDD